jgi:pyruvate/2-oxoglutarate dehydrogenase complex dihydrolipoamide dehydrogenase (E3) component
MSPKTYDVVVIGAGSGGLSSAVGLAKTGKRVLLIERAHLGGECTNSGCIPSKALLHHAQSETYRTDAFTYVRNKIAEILAEETPEHFTKLGIDVLIGEAIFTARTSLSVSGVSYTFKKAIIATGSAPRLLTVDGLTPEHLLTNQNLFQSTTIPDKLLIVGGGPIGMEMGQALALLGSSVTILDNGPEFAKLEDPAIRPIITAQFAKHGITLVQNASLKKVKWRLPLMRSYWR